jgi:hypothetical protein
MISGVFLIYLFFSVIRLWRKIHFLEFFSKILSFVLSKNSEGQGKYCPEMNNMIMSAVML